MKSHGKWDSKRRSPAYEYYGNFHYGVVGRAAGYPRALLLMAGGLVQEIISGTSRVEWGNFWDGYLNDTHDSSYGDDPRDQYWIRKGMEFHDTNHRKRRK